MATSPRNQQTPYELRAQVAGVGFLGPRTALFLWGFGSIFLGVTVSVLLVQGQVRMLVLLLLAVLGVVCIAPRRGLYVLIVFLPFMYYIRRLVLNFQEFDKRDPILLFPVVIALVMFVGTVVFHSSLVFRYFRRSALLKTCALLMLWFGFQVVNPHQDSILMGAAGAMYFIIPMTWCVFGLLMTRRDMNRIFKIIVVIGCITALYGLYQRYFGLTAAELYEMRAKDFLKTFGGLDTVRIMSTFASLGDFSLYMMVSGFLAFSLFWQDKRRLAYLSVAALNIFTMIWMAVRTSFLLLAFSVTVLLIVHGRNRARILVRGAIALFIFIAIYGTLGTYDPEKVYDAQFSDNPYVVHTLSGITHPTQERTFWMRLENWNYIVKSTLTQYPVGHGLGSTTTAAAKFGGKTFVTDSYFFELFYGSGLVAPVLFGMIMILCPRGLLRLCLAAPGEYTFKIAIGLLSGLFLGCIFGGAARDFITGPLVWLIIGWSVREDVNLSEQPYPAEAGGMIS